MIVAPGTAALAAAVTLAAVVPVSSVSPGPCAMAAGSTLPFAAAAVAAFEFPDDDAAPAICDPARIPPASRPAPSRPAAPIQRRGVRVRPDAVPSVSISVLPSRSAPCPASKGMVEDGAVSPIRPACGFGKRGRLPGLRLLCLPEDRVDLGDGVQQLLALGRVDRTLGVARGLRGLPEQVVELRVLLEMVG